MHIEAHISTEQLLRAVEQLPPREFDALVGQLLALRAQRAVPRLSPAETELLLRINDALPPDTQRRVDELVTRRQDEVITPVELAELVQLTDQIEERDARRLAALDELARLRRAPLAELMRSLGISPPPYA